MRAEIPDDADVGLVQSEVDAARGDEVELAERHRVDHLLDGDDRRAVEERVARHQRPAGLAGEPHELGRLLRARCEGLLDEHVLAELQSLRGEVEVRRHRRRDHDRFDVVVRQHLEIRRRPPNGRVAAPPVIQPLLAHVAHDDDLRLLELDEVAKEIRPPVAEPHDRHAERLAHRVAFGRKICNGVLRSSTMSPQNDQLRA